MFRDFFTIWNENSSVKTIYVVLGLAKISTGSSFPSILHDIISIDRHPQKDY